MNNKPILELQMNFQKLFNQIQPFLIVGPPRSPVCLAMQNVIGVLGVPQIGGGSSVLLSDATAAPTFMRVVPSDDVTISALASFLKHFRWLHVAVISTSDEFSQGMIEFHSS
jgi:ABC-type branched-subunit amino acid transport system substrate-binding protein